MLCACSPTEESASEKKEDEAKSSLELKIREAEEMGLKDNGTKLLKAHSFESSWQLFQISGKDPLRLTHRDGNFVRIVTPDLLSGYESRIAEISCDPAPFIKTIDARFAKTDFDKPSLPSPDSGNDYGMVILAKDLCSGKKGRKFKGTASFVAQEVRSEFLSNSPSDREESLPPS